MITATTTPDNYTLSLHDALPISTIIYEFPTAVSPLSKQKPDEPDWTERWEIFAGKMEIANGFSELNDPEDQRRRSEEHTSELQSQFHLVCRLLLEKKNANEHIDL